MDDAEPRRRFEAMWTAHHPAVVAYARRRAPAATADEIAAEVFAVPDRADLVGADAGPLRAAFARLSDRHREVLALVAWEGLEPREVAVVLGVPAAVASARIHRARTRLRRALAEAEGTVALGAREGR